MNIAHAKKIVVLGMISRHPVAGMIWLTLQYLVGLKRLGYDAYYVEPQGGSAGEDCGQTAAWIAWVMERFDLGNQWAYHAVNGDGRCYGLSESGLQDLYRSAALLINLHGSTKPTPQLAATGRLLFLETDPAELEISLYDNEQWVIDFLSPHCAFFSWGENYGKADCKVPRPERFNFRPTRQPVVIDMWEPYSSDASNAFTTIGNWRQPYREVEFQGETYYWSKHHQFLKFIDLPRRTNQTFELALSSYRPEDQQILESHGWKVVPAATFSKDPHVYRDYIAQSRGEFTVAKERYARLRSGWFSDRAATYLAAGKPVINQETGFSNILPTGQGLFAFSTLEEIVEAVESINADYERHSRAALQVAREHFSYDVVLPRLLSEAGI